MTSQKSCIPLIIISLFTLGSILLYFHVAAIPPPTSAKKANLHQSSRTDDEIPTITSDEPTIIMIPSSVKQKREQQQQQQRHLHHEIINTTLLAAPGDPVEIDENVFRALTRKNNQQEIQKYFGPSLQHSKERIEEKDHTLVADEADQQPQTNVNNPMMKSLRETISSFALNSSTNISSAVSFSYLQSLRFLSTEKILAKYGLTNYLLSYASMIAYAAIDKRIVVEPKKSPIALSKLIDIEKTERGLLSLFGLLLPSSSSSFGILTKEEIDSFSLLFQEVQNQESSSSASSSLPSMNYSTEKKTGKKQHINAIEPKKKFVKFSARRAGFEFGVRSETQSAVGEIAAKRFTDSFVHTMHQTVEVPFVVQRDFFESFPFRTIAPIDSCAVIRRMIPAENIRDAAKSILSEMRTKYKVKYWMAVHLRVEADRGLLRRSMRNMAAHKIAEWWRRHVSALADDLQIIDSFYIASGKFDDEILRMIIEIEKEKGRVVLVKSNFSANSKIDTSENKKTMVTSHEAALVDALLMKEAHVTMSFKPSTFAITAAAYRCPNLSTSSSSMNSPRLMNLLQSPWCRQNDKNRTQTQQQTDDKLRPCSVQSVKEKVKTLSIVPKKQNNGNEKAIYPKPTDVALRGIYLYDHIEGSVDVEADAKNSRMKMIFTAPKYYSCLSKNFRDQCFRALDE